MENWITRFVAILCALGSTALLWTFGAFVAVPWHEGRMLALNWVELQVIGVSLVVGLAVTWGALHIFALADQVSNPRIYAAIRALLALASIAAVIGGLSWSQARIA